MTKEELQASPGPYDQAVDEREYDKFNYNNRKPKVYYFKSSALEKA